MPSLGLDMPKKNNKRKNSVRKRVVSTSKEYASVTTAHGFAYIGNDDYPGGDRILWIIIVLMAFGFTVFQMTTLYSDWQDNPVITTLDTVALPIEEIEFPAVTICPQGSLDDIWDSVLFRQLKEYVANKSREMGRKKRSIDSQISFLDFTDKEMLIKAEEFLEDSYPGMKYDDDDKPMPASMSQFLRVMMSDDPERTFQNEAILFPDEKCDPECNGDVLNDLKQHLSDHFCPPGFQVSEAFECIHVKQQEMSYDEASKYCNDLDESELLHMDSVDNFDSMDELITSIFCYKIRTI